MNDDGRAGYSAPQLMILAENKYKSRIQAGLWKKVSADKEAIVALTAEILQLKSTKTGKGQVGAETKTKKSSGAKDRVKKPKWLTEAPKGNESKESGHPIKTIENRKYYWCKHHNQENGQWVRHHPDKCNNAPDTQAPDTANANMASFDTTDSEEEEE
jgi:hypothetical protein